MQIEMPTTNEKIRCSFCEKTLFPTTFIPHIKKYHLAEVKKLNKHTDFTSRFSSMSNKVRFGPNTSFACCFHHNKVWTNEQRALEHFAKGTECKKARIDLFSNITTDEDDNSAANIVTLESIMDAILEIKLEQQHIKELITIRTFANPQNKVEVKVEQKPDKPRVFNSLDEITYDKLMLDEDESISYDYYNGDYEDETPTWKLVLEWWRRYENSPDYKESVLLVPT